MLVVFLSNMDILVKLRVRVLLYGSARCLINISVSGRMSDDDE